MHTPEHNMDGMPETLPYRPGPHKLQLPAPDKEYRPAAHTSAVSLVDPAGHAYPALQLPVHDDTLSPDSDPYRPTSHMPLQLALVSAHVDP